MLEIDPVRFTLFHSKGVENGMIIRFVRDKQVLVGDSREMRSVGSG